VARHSGPYPTGMETPILDCSSSNGGDIVILPLTKLLRMLAMVQPGDPKVETSLATIAIFANLTTDALSKLQRECSWRRYEPGEVIVEYGEESSQVFFISEGDARVTIYSVDGTAVSFRELSAGSIFGEYAAIDQSRRSASVEARSSCLVASLTSPQFRLLLRDEPEVTEALLKHLVTELRELTTRVYEFSTLCVNNRIQAELLRLARRAAHTGNVARIAPAPTHADMASRISTHREAVTRELNRLSRDGLIEQQRQALIVRDIGRLAAMVHEVTGE